MAHGKPRANAMLSKDGSSMDSLLLLMDNGVS